MWPRFRTACIGVTSVALAALFLNNTDLLVDSPSGNPVLLAHRGLAQRYDQTGVKSDTCTATAIRPPTHGYLENTIASMAAAFERGADVVELDVHPTTDGEFAVFHDWTLDCRTDGTGVTREHAMAELKKLDIGYGYTADGGKTFPFRHQGVGLMPTLAEVLQAFPRNSFLINIKSNDPQEGALLATYLAPFLPGAADRVSVYGGDRPVGALKARIPALRTTTRASLKACLIRYLAWGWSGIVPSICRNSVLYVPINYAGWMWGWPNRFLGRIRSAGSEVFIIGPYDGGPFSSGLDTVDQLQSLPQGWSGGIMTNEIDLAAKTLGR